VPPAQALRGDARVRVGGLQQEHVDVLDDHRAALSGRVDSLVAETFDDVAEERAYFGVRLADEDLHRTHHRAPTARISAGSGMEAV
jgi:hypothetical protein